MRNFFLKHFLLSVLGIFLIVPAGLVAAQDVSRFTLPMIPVEITFKEGDVLLTRAQVKKLDMVIQHLQRKPAMHIALITLIQSDISLSRIQMIEGYLLDYAVSKKRMVLVDPALEKNDCVPYTTEPAIENDRVLICEMREKHPKSKMQ